MIFWTIFVSGVLLWYVLVTLLVAVRGGRDIRNMIRKLEEQHNEPKI